MKDMLAWRPQAEDEETSNKLAIWVKAGTIIKTTEEFLWMLSYQIQELLNKEIKELSEEDWTPEKVVSLWEEMWIDRQLWTIEYSSPNRIRSQAIDMIADNEMFKEALWTMTNQEFPTKPIFKMDEEAKKALQWREEAGLLEWSESFSTP